MTNARDLVIVGASHAGVQLAASARESGFQEPIILVGDEAHSPYQRPPLSKGLLSGKTNVDQLQLRSPEFFRDNGIELMLGRRAVGLDAVGRTVRLDDGSTRAYGWLALATGARCRSLPLPGADLPGVFNLRGLDDATALVDGLAQARRACVIGGGFIGLEVASALRAKDLEVTVVETQPLLLARAFPEAMSRFVMQAHRDRDVRFRIGSGVRAFRGQGRVEAVELDDGSRVDCDLVVLGIGVLPNDQLARDAGINADNGILVDALGRTSAPGVLAVGDVANMAFLDAAGTPARWRLESIQAANDGARALASLVAGRPPPAPGVPRFWSDQGDLKFQMAGLPAKGDQAVLRGDMGTERFSVFYLRHGEVVGAHSVNRPAEHMLGRKLVAARARPTPEQLADESFDLKATLSSTATRVTVE